MSVAEELVSMYARDLQLKRLIIDDLLTRTDRDVLLIYITAWEMMPYIDKTRTITEVVPGLV